MSKWIGETEKHLRQVFDAAERGGTLLLFDEADALFGRRSEVRDSHDRYANLEVSYLLQRIEQFRGVAVLTTNMRSAIDPAFLRRLRYVVQFPHPDPDAAGAAVARAFSPAVATEGLDIERLARLDLTGGDITSVAAHAVLLAAAERRTGAHGAHPRRRRRRAGEARAPARRTGGVVTRSRDPAVRPRSDVDEIVVHGVELRQPGALR